MTQRMLIDARHPEETRVAVAQGNRIEEFDFESTEHKQLKGNIYLAKVTRVEPSLQAAFIDYGGNRHGFLAFSEIHPDYYQIPKSDRDALLAEEAEHAAEEERIRAAEYDAAERAEDDGDEGEHDEVGMGSELPPVDESAADELRKKRQALRRRYKIQDVIQRRQVLLVQVVKEERGNKGAALTTYLSLAGRYCVLMPNTSHGGGISRKISNGADRKRLKSIMGDLNLPKTMGLIVRTAGLERTKTEIKRDFDYLARLWDEIRERTLGSTAPALIYRDSDLVKRAIRDLYNRDISEVIVEGDEGYKAARGFMKLLMPSHVKRVSSYGEATPLFQRYGIEDQLNAMYNPVVQLKSGGYLVINPTEALVSIDINSGRSTREHNIEQTAFATNLEAAAEIARQLRLRDMAGLVVIDFIDMEQNSHNRKVEKAMKDALKNDRARIQVGRISSFGLMEMSRQRLRTGVLEASTHACPHCEGTGLMRTASSSGLTALRQIEDEAARGKGTTVTLRCGREAAIYVLNKKRAELAEIEERYGVTIEVIIDEGFEGAKMAVESSGPRPVNRPRSAPPIVEDEDEDELIDDEDEEEDEEESERDEAQDERRGRRRRRRGGRGRNRRPDTDRETSSDEDEDREQEPRSGDDDEDGDGEKRRSRRGRRGGRGRRGRGRREDGAENRVETDGETSPMVETPVSDETPITETVTEDSAEEKPKTRRRPRAAKAVEDAKADAPASDEVAPAKPKRARAKKAEPAAEAASEDAVEEAPKPKRSRAKKADAPSAVQAPVAADEKPKRAAKAAESKAKAPAKPRKTAAKSDEAKPAAKSAPNADEAKASDEVGPDGEPRKGWWQRTFG